MKMVFLPMLLTVLGQGSDDPTMRMKAMEETIAKADSLQVTLESKVETKEGNGSAKGTFTVAGKKGRAELTVEFLGKGMKIQMVSDGTKMATTEEGKPKEVKDVPKNYRSSMTVLLARSGFVALFFLANSSSKDKDDEDLLEVIKISDIKKLKLEKVGGREAMAISYKITIKDDKVTPTATVWLDLKTNLPLKRVLQAEVGGQSITATETYSNFQINPKLDPKMFELPK